MVTPTRSLRKFIRRSSGSIMDNFDVGPGAALTVLIATAAILTAAGVFFIRSAPPSEITFSTGPEGGVFNRIAQRYAKILEANDVRVKILTSQGSNQNLQRLKDDSSGVDVAMVQAGIAVTEAKRGEEAPKISYDDLISLGSISQQPLLVFYRGKPMQLLSELKGRRIAIGPEGSGANILAKEVLGLNGIKVEEGAKLEAMDAEAAANAIQMNLIDAAFIMSESAAFSTLRSLTRSPEIHLYSFQQAQAYVRKLDYLHLLNLPQGGFEIGTNLPEHDVTLIGPAIDLIARKDLHPALSDLLLDAATQVNGRPGMYQQRGEFPAPLEHGIKVSDEAKRYYKEGKTFLYRLFPYWLASLLSRILVIFVPALVILVPAIRAILAFFSWRVRTHLYKRYRELVNLERAFSAETDPARRKELQKEFDRIESGVNRMRIKGSYADQVYALRTHIDYVRRVVSERSPA